jgi:hypothetical protein
VPDYVNSFKTPVYIEETIVDGDGKTIGTIRVKPSGVLWKPSGSSKYYSAPLDGFTAWITDKATGAKRTSS